MVSLPVKVAQPLRDHFGIELNDGKRRLALAQLI
jgi:hypothetical protein